MVSLKNFLKTRLAKLKEEGSFTQGFSWTFSGTSLAFLIQLIFSPIISRIFGPAAYGEFAIYNLFTSNLISISSLAYPQALIINNRSKQYFSLSLFIFGLSLISVTFFCIVYFMFSDYWNSIFDLNTGMVVIISLATIFAVLNDIFSKWNLITNKLKRNTVVNISITSISKIYTIGFGKYISPSGWGLISAELLKLCLISTIIFKKTTYNSIFRKLRELNRVQINQSYTKAKQLKNYPFFIWPGNWLNMFSNQLPIIFFTMYFSMDELGAYTFAASMVAIPNQLVGNAIRPIFFKKSRDILDESGNLYIFTKKVTMYLFPIALPVFFILFISGETIFQFIFGSDWITAGNVASKLSIFHLIAFPISPVSSIFLTLKFEKRILSFQMFLFATRLLVLGFCAFEEISFLDTVLAYSFANALAYFILYIVINTTLKNHD